MKSRALLSLLSDGQIHSGESLASSLGVSRTAIWKQIRKASQEGYVIETIRGKGYRLMTRLDLLDADVILAEIPASLRSGVSLEILDEVDSTNAELIRRRDRSSSKSTMVCLAEHQTAGRGRRGRQWQSPRGENLYVSLALTFRGGFAMLDGLSLALGMAVAEALEKRGSRDVGLKWPNDIFIAGSKLAGILVELQGELEEGVVQVVVGVGINVHMSRADAIEQSWTSLSKAMPDTHWQRSLIAADVIASVLDVSEEFRAVGFGGVRERWQARDVFLGQSLAAVDGTLLGVGRGVDLQGNYLIEAGGEIESVRAGEISMRAQP